MPPFRADHVGSLLRPARLHDARAKAAARNVSPAAELRAIEDECIREAVALQEAAGISAITDGEFRRGHYLVDFLTAFSGIVPTQTSYALAFKGEDGASGETRSMLTVTEQGEAHAAGDGRGLQVPQSGDQAHGESVPPLAHLAAHARRPEDGERGASIPISKSSGATSCRRSMRRSATSRRRAAPICNWTRSALRSSAMPRSASASAPTGSIPTI